MKKIIKKLTGDLLGNDFVVDIIKSFNRRKLIILYYHRIVKDEEAKDANKINMYTNFTRFNDQMKFLKKFYHLVNEEEIIAVLEGRKKLPRYAVWITFDDGYKDNFANAYPVLKKYGIPATFFIPTGYINKNGVFMNWDEISELSRNGFSIGAHTLNHQILSQLSDDKVLYEISKSKKDIENRIHKRVISFAYPHGKRNDFKLEVCSPILERSGFKLAVTTIGGFNRLNTESKNFKLKRMGISYEDDLEFFKLKVSLGSFWQS